MLEKLFFISLLLSITGLFRFIAPQFGVSIAIISQALLAINLLYLVTRLGVIEKMFQKMLPWLVVLMVWPLLTVIYAPAIELRQLGILLSNFTLFAGGAVYAMSSGLASVSRLFTVSMVITVFGLVLSMLLPDYFESTALLADANNFAMNRPGGFFLQPNSLATGLTFMFLSWLAFAKRNTVYFEPIIILAFLGFLILSGSRSGIIVGVLIVALHFSYQWRNSLFGSRRVRKFARRMAIFIVLIIFGLMGMKQFIEIYREIIEVIPGGIIDRISNMLELRLQDEGVSIAEGGSFLSRLEAQRYFVILIWERPFLGHGYGSDVAYLDAGILYKSAHSSLLSTTMTFGVFYPLAFLALLAKMFFNPNRKKIEVTLGANSIVQFLVAVLLLFIFNGGLMGDRPFLVLLGMVFAVSAFPSCLFGKHATKTARRLRAHPGRQAPGHPLPGGTKHKTHRL